MFIKNMETILIALTLLDEYDHHATHTCFQIIHLKESLYLYRNTGAWTPGAEYLKPHSIWSMCYGEEGESYPVLLLSSHLYGYNGNENMPYELIYSIDPDGDNVTGQGGDFVFVRLLEEHARPY